MGKALHRKQIAVRASGGQTRGTGISYSAPTLSNQLTEEQLEDIRLRHEEVEDRAWEKSTYVDALVDTCESILALWHEEMGVPSETVDLLMEFIEPLAEKCCTNEGTDLVRFASSLYTKAEKVNSGVLVTAGVVIQRLQEIERELEEPNQTEDTMSATTNPAVNQTINPTLVSAAAAASLDKKMIDKYEKEDVDTARLHRQRDCFFCNRPWYLSDGKLQFHQNQQQANPTWKMPTSCPQCRVKSRMEGIEAHQSKCPTGKREFKTPRDAQTFSRETVQKSGLPEQRSYLCPDCNFYHLTTQEPVEAVSSGALVSPLSKIQQPVAAKPAKKVGESRSEVALLLQQGLSTTEIAARLDMTTANVLYHKKNIEGTATPAKKPAVFNVDEFNVNDLDAQAENLRKQLAEIEAKKVRLAEAKMLRVEVVNGAISIRKEGEKMILPMSELENLISLLMELPQPQSAAA